MVADLAADRDDAQVLCAAVRAAGRVARAHFREPVRQWQKDDGSPVSAADHASNDVLIKALLEARPHYGLVSEEGGAGAANAKRTFVVDPIDGTRGFLRGEPYWSVVAAVIEEGRPVAGAVYEPVSDRLSSAWHGGGASCNGAPITVSSTGAVCGAEIAIPASVFRDRGLKAAGVRKAAVLPSLAVRLQRVAEGRFDAVVTKPGAHHWDLAAADVIIHEAGGALFDLRGSQLRYDAPETSHPAIVAGPVALARALVRQFGQSHEALAN